MKKSKSKTPKIIVPDGTETTDATSPSTKREEAQAAPHDARAEAGTHKAGKESADALREKVEQLTEHLARAKADYRNLQRRTANETASAVRYANAELMKSLLTVLDDFERALSAAEADADPKALMEGVRLVYANLKRALEDAGLQRIDALHRPFDPTQHEALMQQPTSEHPPNTVIEEVTKGYRLHERVLRPAKVIVSRPPDASPPNGNGRKHSPPEEAAEVQE